MKKLRSFLRLPIAGLLLAMAVALAGCGGPRAIQWKEPVVEQAVREYLGRPEGDIRPEDLADIWWVTLVGDRCVINQSANVQTVSARTGDAVLNVATGASRTSQGSSPGSITTLEDFAHFPGLDRLELYDMSFERLNGVERLAENQRLRELVLAFNSNLSTLEGIGQLGRLTKLRLVGLPVSDLSELEQLTFLTMLNLEDVSVQDTEFFAGLESLEELYVRQAGPADWAPALRCRKLMRYDIRQTDGTTLGNVQAF